MIGAWLGGGVARPGCGFGRENAGVRGEDGFQTICYKLSAAMIEAKPEDAPAFALDFLRKLKAENAEAAVL